MNGRTTNGGGRFLTKILSFGILWALIIYTLYQFRSISIDVPVPHLNSRFLLQKRLDPLTRHADSTTESMGFGAVRRQEPQFVGG
ncbi:hypothetical protein NQ314_014751 [Rhamnusium bicolor]|uniref:Uncharacterized protein n=1 Tax=Rhamnusium bicolor TaxID=1586634 RepID=A0AAV8X197_9CUCU|nr:hypothetical protein NQ314_014751 [Rhamnusium bicolor]